MLLGVAWRDAGPEIDRMSRYESRLRVRYEKAIKRLDSLIATRPQQAEPEPAPTPDPPSPSQNRARQQAAPTEKPVLPNEPNFDLKPDNATPISNKPAAPAAPPSTPPDLADKLW